MGVRLQLEHWRNRLRWVASNPVTWVVCGAAMVAIVFAYMMASRLEHVVVSAMHWAYTYKVEKYKIRLFEDFDVPADAFEVRSLGQRIHHYEQVFDGYTTESYQCGQSCSGQGASYSCITQTCTRSVPQYHDEPVYRPYYAYRAWRWGFDRKVLIEERDTRVRPIAWHEFGFNENLGQGQRERYTRSGDFEVTLTSSDDSWEYEPDDEAEFSRYTMRQPLTIRVNRFGSILDAGFGE